MACTQQELLLCQALAVTKDISWGVPSLSLLLGALRYVYMSTYCQSCILTARKRVSCRLGPCLDA